jgi:hypothetical protein
MKKSPTYEAWFVGGKNISEEAMKIRKRAVNKIFKFGCLPIIIFIAIIFLLVSIFPGPVIETDPMNIGDENVKALAGLVMQDDQFSDWGNADTLYSSNHRYLVIYLDSANVSFVVHKGTQIIEFAGLGKDAASDYLSEIKAKIDAQFSTWNGSHINLTKLIKQNMNDPSSYEHISTDYWDMNDHLVVLTKYRGNNAFGGKVAGYVKAKVDLNGNVIEIMENQ